MKTSIAPTTVRGENKFVLNIRHADGKRERKFFDKRKEAESAEGALRAQVAVGGSIWVTLSAKEQAEVMFVIKEATDLGTTARGLLDFYKAQFHLAEKASNRTLQQLIDDTIQTATNANCRPRYISSLKTTLDKFALGRTTLPISAAAPLVAPWLNEQKGRGGGRSAANTFNGLRSRLSALFSEAVAKGDMKEDNHPIKRKRIKPAKSDDQEIKFFTPQQVSDLLWCCRQTDRPFLAYIVLGLFEGVRPEELEKLKWADFEFEMGRLIMEKKGAKKRERRIIQLEPITLAWLKECDQSGEYVVPFIAAKAKALRAAMDKKLDHKTIITIQKGITQLIKRHRNPLCERSGVKWIQDGLRHTAASYLMQKFNDEKVVAQRLGNSPSVLFESYLGLIRKEMGEAFWGLAPAAVPNNIIVLPKGGKGIKRPGKLINVAVAV